MVFNSIGFFIFFAAFFTLYWFVFNQSLKYQNLLILAGSYLFYAWWDWRFLALLAVTSLVNYLLGLAIHKTPGIRKRRFLLFLGLLQGIGLLVFFKYFNFFIDSFVSAFSIFNIDLSVHHLNLILPVGISFYTFRALSYLIDVDSEKIEPSSDWVIFFSYISFFPSLLSGPIDKARTFIPQLEKKREFNYEQGMSGLGQILWGLFKKIVIANNCAAITGNIFDGYQSLPGSTLILGAFLYLIEIYADFSGYSDMAIGLARLLGFNITRNFHYPFFAQNIADFWQRWHISLTSWMTEYVFTPLSFIFRNIGKAGLFFAILINFIIVGLWHGASWNFVIFGFLQGCYFIPLIIKGTLNKRNIHSKDKPGLTFRQKINIAGTFILVMLTTVLLKAETLHDTLQYYKRLFSRSILSVPVIPSNQLNAAITLLFILMMFIIEWFGKKDEYPIARLGLKRPRLVRWAYYYCFAMITFLFASKGQQFIYFQF